MAVILKPFTIRQWNFQDFHSLMDAFTCQNFSKIHEGEVGTSLKFGPFHMEWSKCDIGLKLVKGGGNLKYGEVSSNLKDNVNIFCRFFSNVANLLLQKLPNLKNKFGIKTTT